MSRGNGSLILCPSVKSINRIINNRECITQRIQAPDVLEKLLFRITFTYISVEEIEIPVVEL